MRRAANSTPTSSTHLVWDLLTFDRLIAGGIIHLIYWSGLGVIALLGFFAIGASAGLALHSGSTGWMLAVPALIGGLLVMFALSLIWRAGCEFYVAIARISDDLHALRRNDEAAAAAQAQRAAAARGEG
jgi:hypothetical protein